MTVLDLTSTERLFYQGTELAALYYGATKLWPGAITCPLTQPPPPLSSGYAVVMDVTNGCVLFEKMPTLSWTNEAASLVKLLTAMAVIQAKSGVLASETITVTGADTGKGGIAPGLTVGDTATWEDWLANMLMPSSNDAAYVLARCLGNHLYAQAGNTGASGVTRALQAMNAIAAGLGAASVVCSSPDYQVAGNSRDFMKVVTAAYNVPKILELCGLVSKVITITGPSARTPTITNSDRMVNGPWAAPAGHKHTNVLAGKIGNLGGSYAEASRWQTPNGTLVDILTVAAPDNGNDFVRYLDVYALYHAAIQTYPHLSAGAALPVDPLWANVQLLADWEDGFTDKSPAARPMTAFGAPVIGAASRIHGAKGLTLDGVDDRITVPDAAGLNFEAGDFCIEMWHGRANQNTGSGGWNNILSKVDATDFFGTLEWAIAANSGGEVQGNAMQANGDRKVAALQPGASYWNGAPRHTCLTRHGNTLRLYVDGESGGSGKLAIAGALRDLANVVNIGALGHSTAGGQEYAKGSIDAIRITKGSSRYGDVDRFTVDPRPFYSPSPEAIVLPTPLPHRLWRLRWVRSPSMFRANLAGLEWRTVPGGAALPVVTPIAGSTAEGAAANAYDGNPATYWGSNDASVSNGHWIGADFDGAEQEIREIAVQAHADGTWGPANTLTAGVVEYSDNLGVWRESWSFVTTAFAAGQTKVFTKP